jgi:CRISPR-associated protein Csb1
MTFPLPIVLLPIVLFCKGDTLMFTEMFTDLKSASRLLLEAKLAPVQGTRFQPTGFPDLGAAEYRLPDGTVMLLVESPQSVANRLEATIWDTANKTVVKELQGIPYVEVYDQSGDFLTNSLLEAHRLNSNYILESKDDSFLNILKQELEIAPDKPLKFECFAKLLVKYDLNCLLHGLFLAKSEIAGGRYKMPRALSGFIEAHGVEKVVSGGVKLDRINAKGDAEQGAGNIPYHRVEYTAREIKAYFSLDLAQIYGYGLGDDVENLLIAIALWKIQKFLENGLRLRTACDLEVVALNVKKPAGFELPSIEVLSEALPNLIKNAQPAFANPAITKVTYIPKSKKNKGNRATGNAPDTEAVEG